MVSSKPQIQEKLTAEIIEKIKSRLSPVGIGIAPEAIRTCVFARGVQSNKTEFTSNIMYGESKESPQTRSGFVSLISREV